MRRKIISLFIILLLFASVIEPASADNSGLCFTAINDTLQDLGSMTSFVNGTAYVPAKALFSLGVYTSSFHDANETVMLNNSSNQMYFEMKTGNCYDNTGYTYQTAAIYQNGQVYVPAYFICTYFDFTCNPISGIGYGDILRITNGKTQLSNQQFLDAAKPLMRSHYNEYYGSSSNTVIPPSPTPPEPSLPINDNTSKSANIYLCFVGVPSEGILNSLDRYNYKACFFVTADEAKSSPDIIRRICGSGHNIGVNCVTSAKSDCDAAVSAIFEAAQVRPVIITSAGSISKSCYEYASTNGFAYFSSGIAIPESAKYASTVTSKLDNSSGNLKVSFSSNDNTEKMLPGILQYINAKGMSVSLLRETNI